MQGKKAREGKRQEEARGQGGDKGTSDRVKSQLFEY